MLERLATCLCHPKKIGMFFKDKYNYVVTLVLTFLVLLLGVASIRIFNTKYFAYDDAKDVYQAVQGIDNSTNLVFDSATMTLSGNGKASQKNGILVYFLRTSNIQYGTSLTYDFHEDNVDIYYQMLHLGNVKYKDYALSNNLSIADVVNGNVDAKMEFTEFVYDLNGRVNQGLSLIQFGVFVIDALMYYAIVIAISLVCTYMFNPTIDLKMRFKLILMSTLVYFLIMIFYVLFAYEWIKYLAMSIPVIYSIIALSHIRKVSKKNL